MALQYSVHLCGDESSISHIWPSVRDQVWILYDWYWKDWWAVDRHLNFIGHRGSGQDMVQRSEEHGGRASRPSFDIFIHSTRKDTSKYIGYR